ncbi:MAG: exodeoxyribonuclease VII large subunit [Methanolinea sp.]|nr:exodeoxyribonuclease VII large subunit [Methanolinea sp.]
MPWYQERESQGQGEMQPGVYTVSEISSLIGSLLDDPRIHDIWVRGEVTNFKLHGSGHCFFSLGERTENTSALISCVMWRTDAARLPAGISDGMDVFVFGSVGHYSPQGRYQLYVRDIRPAGRGEKYLQVEQWKVLLSSEGCFDSARKRPLPSFPVRIGVVTSETGAVLQDIKNIISRRYPLEVVVSPTVVQGEGAHLEIARAITRLYGRADVIIVARGGGSFEDLFPFNHPDVVRAVSASPVPVVSAIGHEVDAPLADFAADVRAPTPSAAAELVVPDRIAIREALGDFRKALCARLLGKLDRAATEIAELRERFSPRRMEQRLNVRREDLNVLETRMLRAMTARIDRGRERVSAMAHILEAKNPCQVLGRGYCILTRQGRVIRSAREVSPGDRLSARLSDGTIDTIVHEVRHDPEV